MNSYQGYAVRHNTRGIPMTLDNMRRKAAGHRANAEAFLELAVLRNKPQYVEMAMEQYQEAYYVEGAGL